MRTQDLRDNERDRKRYFFHKRGWLKHWQWEALLCRSRFKEHILTCNLSLGGEDPREVQFTFALLGAAIYLTFHNLLPEKWAVGWYMRGEVKNPRWHEDSMGKDWGFYIYDDSFVFQWNHTAAVSGKDPKYGYSKHFYFPWSWGSSVRNQVLTADGKWVDAPYEARSKAWRNLRKLNPDASFFDLKDADYPDLAEYHTADYTYTRKNGEVQKRIAKFHVEEREWRWLMFHKLPFAFGPKLVNRCIDVRFDKEVGEKSGSWKGGTTGCGYEMKRGETPLECLRRMEKERKF